MKLHFREKQQQVSKYLTEYTDLIVYLKEFSFIEHPHSDGLCFYYGNLKNNGITYTVILKHPRVILENEKTPIEITLRVQAKKNNLNPKYKIEDALDRLLKDYEAWFASRQAPEPSPKLDPAS